MNVDLADCPRHNWYGPDSLLRALAKDTGDGVAQWQAKRISDMNLETPAEPRLNFVWYEPSVPVRSPEGLPTLHHFSDLGIVSARKDWSERGALVVFKCGPALGRFAMSRYFGDLKVAANDTAEILKHEFCSKSGA